jgi:hypothetical protein
MSGNQNSCGWADATGNRKPRRHHADDRPAACAETDLLTNDVGRAAEPALPKFMAYHDDLRRAVLVFFGGEDAPLCRTHA